MLKKIDISKISTNTLPNKTAQNIHLNAIFQSADDEFVKIEKSKDVLENVNGLLSRVNFIKLVNNLLNVQYWTDGMNYVGFPNDKVINKVGVGLFDKKKADVIKHVISVDDFSDIMTDVTAVNIVKKPEQEFEFKKLYLALLDYLKEIGRAYV